MESNPPIHIRFLNLLSALRDLSPFNAMSAEEETLLRDLIVRWHGEDNIPVSEIMRDLAGVSQATAYRRLIALRDKGMISLRVDHRDRRVKFVDPTALADEYARRIHQALEQVADGHTSA